MTVNDEGPNEVPSDAVGEPGRRTVAAPPGHRLGTGPALAAAGVAVALVLGTAVMLNRTGSDGDAGGVVATSPSAGAVATGASGATGASRATDATGATDASGASGSASGVPGTRLPGTTRATGSPGAAASGGAGSTGGRSSPAGPGASPTSVDDAAARVAACSIGSSSISSLVAPPPGEPGGGPADLLRDAVPNLGADLATWSDAARGRPELAAAVGVVADVWTHWTAALRAYDSGDEGTATSETRAAESDLARLDPLVATARKALGARC